MWGFYSWWIFPAIGLVMCLAIMVIMAFFCITNGCGCIRMRGRH